MVTKYTVNVCFMRHVFGQLMAHHMYMLCMFDVNIGIGEKKKKFSWLKCVYWNVVVVNRKKRHRLQLTR